MLYGPQTDTIQETVGPHVTTKPASGRKLFMATIDGDIMNWVLVQQADPIYIRVSLRFNCGKPRYCHN